MEDNKLPTIQIRGNQYVLVKDRVIAFNELYPNGYIATQMISPPDAKTVIFKAQVVPDCEKPQRVFMGHSQAIVGSGGIMDTAPHEVAETSAVGRALAFMGLGLIESIASADEMNKATYQKPTLETPAFTEPREKTDFDPRKGDKLKTGISSKTGKPWYCIEHSDKSREWLKEHQYNTLKELQ